MQRVNQAHLTVSAVFEALLFGFQADTTTTTTTALFVDEQWRVSLHVLAQVVRPHEPIETHCAHELFLARVCPKVAREFVGARKRLGAAVPLAYVRTFARVHSDVRFQVGALEVAFVAVVEGARMVACLQAVRVVALTAIAAGRGRKRRR